MARDLILTVGFRGPIGPRGPGAQYYSREEAEAAEPLAVETIINVDGLLYKRDPNGTALTTGDGSTWSPADEITSAHWGAPMNGVDDDAPAIQAAIDYAAASPKKRVRITGMVWISYIEIPSNIELIFEGPQTTIGTEGFALNGKSGDFVRNTKISGINLLGNNNMDGGFLMEGFQYCTVYDPMITGFNKPGAWGMVLSGDEENRNSSSNLIMNPNITLCNNLIKFGTNPAIGGSHNTGASFNTFIGGFNGPFGDNTEEYQYGVLVEVGEGNKFVNMRVSTSRHHAICWEIMDARTQLIGTAGDGPCFTAFVYPLAGSPGNTVNSITLLGTPLLTTPVEWQGTRMATSEAIVAQIEADGNQHPNTEFFAMAHDEQVMFWRIDNQGNKVRLTTAELANISVTTTGVVTGHSGINLGLLQGPPYSNYPDVNTTKWGYRAGHGGVWETYGVRFRANPGGSGRGGGSLIEPEGNGPRHVIWFDDETTQRSVNVVQAGSTVISGETLTTDAVQQNLDGRIQVTPTSGNVSISHAQQRLRIINFGPMIFAEIVLRFTPTITTNGQLYFEFPEVPGLYNTVTPLDINGMQYNIPITISGTSLTSQPYLSIFGGQTSPNGHPFARLMTAQGTIASTSIMSSGQEVQIRGWGHWPVNRF